MFEMIYKGIFFYCFTKLAYYLDLQNDLTVDFCIEIMLSVSCPATCLKRSVLVPVAKLASSSPVFLSSGNMAYLAPIVLCLVLAVETHAQGYYGGGYGYGVSSSILYWMSSSFNGMCLVLFKTNSVSQHLKRLTKNLFVTMLKHFLI